MFQMDIDSATLRHQEMLRRAAQNRLARAAMEANGGTMLKRMVTLLTRIRRRSPENSAPVTLSPRQTLVNVEGC
jgi:hypothetical protein